MAEICKGYSSEQIATNLGRSINTVRNQTISLYRKLGVSTRSGVVALRVQALELEVRRLRKAMRKLDSRRGLGYATSPLWPFQSRRSNALGALILSHSVIALE
ncbi:MAG: hypothetical protein IAI50_09275 [Candidatus Eremiobacteraeota bacterium]|nr:hypothetical protein [Candidatus Eremiobacteraeota bacterium]